MANFNFDKVMLGGRICTEPEQKMTKNGDVYICFKIAVNHKKRKDEEKSSTSYFECNAFGNTASFVRDHFHKGNAIFVEGELYAPSFKDKNGNWQHLLYVTAEDVTFVESKSEREGTGDPEFEDVTADELDL